MSIFDDIPLPIGTKYYEKEIIDWDPAAQKYLVERIITLSGQKEEAWLPRGPVERAHASSLMEGVEVREAKPGNSYNTRYFRSNTR